MKERGRGGGRDEKLEIGGDGRAIEEIKGNIWSRLELKCTAGSELTIASG